MRICIVGAGAVGGVLGGYLARAGEKVTLIARGAHLETIRSQGLQLISQEGQQEVIHPALATDDLATAGPQDLVIVAVKAHSLAEIAPQLEPLYTPDTPLLIAQNGIPWWYFYKHGGPHEGHRLQAVDPEGKLAQYLDVERVIGCVVYLASGIVEPGVVRYGQNLRFVLGEPDGSDSERLSQIHQVFQSAQLNASTTGMIRREIWAKIWGNVALNPISALTRANQAEICTFSPTRDLVRTLMTETEAVAAKLNITFPVTMEDRLARIQSVGFHRTSMLQDVEQGRPVEIEAIGGAVAEIGELVGVPTPHVEAITACVRLLDRTLRS